MINKGEKEKMRKSEGVQALLELQNLTEFLQEEPVEATGCYRD